MKTKTQDCNGNPIVASGSYRAEKPVAQIEWELKQTPKGFAFSASGTIRGSAGQCLEAIASAHPEDKTIREIVSVWRKYHLNDMKPGTETQIALGWGQGRDVALDVTTMTEPQKRALAARNLARVQKPRADWIAEKLEELADNKRVRVSFWKAMTGKEMTIYNEQVFNRALQPASKGYLGASLEADKMRAQIAAELDKQAANLFPVEPVKSEVFPDSMGAPCPDTGRLYGHEWFFHTIPAEVVEQIKSWNAKDNTEGVSSYDRQAADFLSENGVSIRITLSDTKPPAWSDNHGGHHYRVTLSRKGDCLAFDYWGSIRDAKEKRDPSAYDVLACISSDSYCPATLADFCAEMGGDPDSLKTIQTFRRCSAFAKRLRAFFTASELEQLREIS